MRILISKRGFLTIVFLFFTWCFNANAQQANKTVLRGIVLEDKTGLYIPYAVIVVDGTSEGTSSDSEGMFVLQTSHPSPNLKVSCMGYNPVVINIPSGFTGYLTIKLAASTITLNEVVVKAGRVKYRNKENPAVSLIDSVIANKQKNRIENFDYLQYEKYEKVQFSLSNISESIKNSKLLGKVSFIFNNIDTSKQSGKEVLPMYITETLSDYYYKKIPKTTNEVVKANKMVSLEGYLDNQGMTGYLKYLYEDINIYESNILFLTNQFISPISGTATTFYRYYIIDTVSIGERKCARLFFTPRNKTDMLFQGYLFVTLDGAYAVNKVDMAVNSKINLNWVKDTKIVQEFENYNHQGWVISRDELSVDFGITKNGLGVYGQRSVSYKKYNINSPIPESKFTVASPNVDSVRQPDSFWEQNRHLELSRSEKGVYTTIDSLKHVKAFVRTLDLFRILIASFHDLGPVEIGPIITYYSYNPIEGSKFRLGGRTTPKFSKKLNFDGYLAYGLKDQKFKYNIGTTYSFTKKTIYEFPVKSLKVSYQVDTKVPGQELYFVQEGNAMLSLNRGVEDKLFYNKSLKVDYLHEFKNHFSYSLGYNYTRQSPGGTLNFNTSNYLSPINNIPYLDISELHVNLRYAPFEDFYQGKLYRSPITNKYPVFELKYSYGSKALGNDYNYHSLRFSAYKRFYPSVIGYTTVTLDAGKIFGKVPYPLLDIHNANQSYFYQSTAYNLMNFLEFVSDQYTSLNVDHCFNGFIFNKIPLFNRLGLREIVTFKVLYGSLSKSNNPDNQPDLLKFPTDKDGNPTTFALGKTPYAEVSVGVSNIFKFVRVDLVRRLTYLDHPNVSKTGIRIMFKFDL